MQLTNKLKLSRADKQLIDCFESNVEGVESNETDMVAIALNVSHRTIGGMWM